MNPFRRGADEALPDLRPTEAVRDAVSQMVKQFADPYALGRELVQNSIDAGAKRIEVRVLYDSDENLTRVIVTDDGAGMTLDIIERCLLTLFRSSKEGDRTKIGKFGVGFFSVFALNPIEVLVDTGTDPEHAGHRVVLRPDFSFDIEESSGRKGTAVTLKLRATKSEAKEHAERLRAALHRWCPFVEVPLRVLSDVPGESYDEQIDRPFGAPCNVAISRKDRDGTLYSLGVAPQQFGPVTGYYRRGILLHATKDALAPALVVRVDSPNLGHTLSRDDVRRDQHFEQVVATVKTLVESDLCPGVQEALLRCCEACAAARKSGSIAEKQASLWFELSAFLVGRTLPLVYPLTNAVQGRNVSVAGSPPKFVAEGPSRLTEVLASKRIPVVDLGAFGSGAASQLIRLLERELKKEPTDPRSNYCLPRVLHEGQCTTDEVLLLTALREVGPMVGLSSIYLADPFGQGSDRFYLALDPETVESAQDAVLLETGALNDSLFSFFSTRALVLGRTHERVRAAAALASKDPPLGASMLLRMVLADAGKLDAKRNAAIVQWIASNRG